ncbi:hypothetical protein ACIGKR_32610 [Rhodococcus qingshengii]|uniref:hypothetical protein n=1 Tax=Rhodococcus qingshengii TaxID=334542 RepID=UPI0037C7B4E0
MSDEHVGSLVEDLTALLAQRPGDSPNSDALSMLGGWSRIASEARSANDSPILVPLVSLIAREVADPHNRIDNYPAALDAVAAAVMASENPSVFGTSLNILIGTPCALETVGDSLAQSLEIVVNEFHTLEAPTGRTVLRTSEALEALTRLSLGGFGSSFAFLAALERFRGPVPKRLATSVIRSVGTAIDYWPEADRLNVVIRRVAGIDPAMGPEREDGEPAEVASDAAWALACIELVRALRADTLATMAEHLQNTASRLKLARDGYGREDAGVLLAVVDIIGSLLRESGVPPTVAELATPHLAPGSINDLVERVRRYNFAASGLNHWYTDPKRATLLVWTRLVDDLATLRTQFARDAFYNAEVVIDDLLQIYIGSRSILIARREADSQVLLDLVQPILETGFAAKAGLLSNLEDHTHELEKQIDSATGARRATLAPQLEAAQSVLAAARAHALGRTSQGKGDGGTASTPLPPPLDQLVPPNSAAATELRSLSLPALTEISRAVDSRTLGKRSLNLVEQEVFTALRTALSSSPDYRGDAAEAVDQVVRLIIRFVTTRTNAQSDHYGYLFDPSANESKIHEDLYSFLVSSELGSVTEFEVQHIGGGRIDLRMKFDGFAIHIEMKVDSTKVPMADKLAYLSQAAAYQVTDIRIGFLVALRHKAFSETGPPPHLSSLISHTTFDIEADPVPRHIVLVQVPGSRTKPSKMK